MPTRKVLRAVAHNIGHSFTSLGAYCLDDSWAIQHLVLACRAAGEPSVEIDLVSGLLTPAEVRTRSVLRAVEMLREHFVDMLIRSDSSPDFVASATLSLRFHLDQTIPGSAPGHWFAPHVIVPEQVPFDCQVTIVDDCGVEHCARVKEWWRS